MVKKHVFSVSQNIFKNFKTFLISLIILHMYWLLDSDEYYIKNTFQPSHILQFTSC